MLHASFGIFLFIIIIMFLSVFCLLRACLLASRLLSLVACDFVVFIFCNYGILFANYWIRYSRKWEIITWQFFTQPHPQPQGEEDDLLLPGFVHLWSAVFSMGGIWCKDDAKIISIVHWFKILQPPTSCSFRVPKSVTHSFNDFS